MAIMSDCAISVENQNHVPEKRRVSMIFVGHGGLKKDLDLLWKTFLDMLDTILRSETSLEDLGYCSWSKDNPSAVPPFPSAGIKP